MTATAKYDKSKSITYWSHNIKITLVSTIINGKIYRLTPIFKGPADTIRCIETNDMLFVDTIRYDTFRYIDPACGIDLFSLDRDDGLRKVNVIIALLWEWNQVKNFPGYRRMHGIVENTLNSMSTFQYKDWNLLLTCCVQFEEDILS